MKKLLSLLVVALLLIACEKQQDSRKKKVVLIIIDGVPADILERVETPAIDDIASVGGYARAYQGGEKGAYSETPTISAPGYMNMITGVWGYKHNVWGNAVRNPNYSYWNIFRMVEELQPELQTAIFSTWLDNRTKLIGESKPEAGGINLDYAFDGFELDTVTFPHGKDRLFIYNIDEHVSKEAARYIEEEAPDLSWVYLEYTDDIGHGFGDGPEMMDAVKKADVQINRIWKAVKHREANFDEDWVITVTTDHGRHPWGGGNHGGQTDRERITWVTTNQQDLNERFYNGLAVVDILPTTLRHLGLEIPDKIQSELDGTSFAGNISFHSPRAQVIDEKIQLTWVPVGEGDIEVLMTKTNSYAQGEEDRYELLGIVGIKDGVFKSKLEVDTITYKFLLKGEHNWSNTWLYQKSHE